MTDQGLNIDDGPSVRAGLGHSHLGLGSSGKYSSSHSRSLEVNVVRSQITVTDYPMDVISQGKGTTCTCVMFCLWVAGNVAGTVAVNIAIQVATMTPLLIVVRAGLGRSHFGLGSSGKYSSSHSRSLEVNVVRSQITVSDCPMDVISEAKGAGAGAFVVVYSTRGND
ncbi:hypothetical protein DFJ58DRAFT_723907 [Suillus subalutaceus]|uniref:uncharacterized protein n=1 Tax=Suillus subalutaceus TaxID=48586 RepID=UPI001B863538|nr:uncharacterized protein DFJ58DRAFT_723907 [Suillus subalutaceus]KAG1867228.1 hypothetical protein DFJ58DRAFT_723907 [Suillus subalutaceus]